MPATEVFFDSNVVLYLISADDAKAQRSEQLIAAGGTVSVQVLNEFAAVALRKFALNHAEIREVLEPIRSLCRVKPLTEEIHDQGLWIAERYRLSLYDAMIVAAALSGGCTVLYSEDLQDGQRFEDRMLVRNPYRV